MRTTACCVLVLLLSAPLLAQQAGGNVFEPLAFLVGDWAGTGEGQGVQSTGAFSFTWDLQQKILVRRSNAEFPATKELPAQSHSDLMVVYPAPGGRSLQAIYFDNEGHVIPYRVESKSPGSVVFVSETSTTRPLYRLTYKKTGGDTVALKFEIASAGRPQDFNTYSKGSARRKASRP